MEGQATSSHRAVTKLLDRYPGSYGETKYVDGMDHLNGEAVSQTMPQRFDDPWRISGGIVLLCRTNNGVLAWHATR